jgi:hypothetical protein
VDHLEGKGRERAMVIPRFQGGSPCMLKTASFWPRWQALTCTDRMSCLWGPINLVA